jgi:hypothetical protein
MANQSVSRISLEIYHARRAREATVTPTEFAAANERVARAFEAFRAAIGAK